MNEIPRRKAPQDDVPVSYSVMHTAYLGTSQFAVTVLESLAGSSYKPVLVVTMPDRPRGRGLKVSPPPVAVAAERLGIPVLQPESVNSEGSRSEIGRVNPDVICVCAYGGLIKEPLLSDYPTLNVHPSLLPRWRGAAPIERAIMSGDGETGVTIMKVTAGLDSGPIAMQRAVPIGPDADFGRLSGQLADLAGELLIETLGLHEEGELSFTEQDDDRATYAEKIESEDRRLDFARPARNLADQVRALCPDIGAYAETPDGGRLKVLKAGAVDGELPPGQVEVGDGRIIVGCRGGSLELLEVQPAGKRPMSAEAYMHGHEVPDRLGS